MSHKHVPYTRSLEATNVQRLTQEVLVICGQLGSQKHHL